MTAAKLASKRNRRRKALRVLGLAGVSLSLAGGASASTSGSATDIPAQKVTPPHEIILGEEEITDVSFVEAVVCLWDVAASASRQTAPAASPRWPRCAGPYSA